MGDDVTGSRVRRFVYNQPYGVLFCTRDLLNFGPREIIDTVLSRMVKKEVIIRVARGVFVKLKEGIDLPSVADIAAVKAKAFGRKILVHGQNASVRAIHGPGTETAPHVFATDGGSTSFATIGGRVYFKRYAPRILKHADTPHGLVIRALWELRKESMTNELIRDITWRLGRTQLADLRKCCDVMPEWMANLVAFALGVDLIAA